ncbi:MAG TPA: diguanylate cyclase [Methylophilaceae bacterium]|nr:diguanylate cyclase [Methylophilaceae bacterium]
MNKNSRTQGYLLFTLLLSAAALISNKVQWDSSASLHTIMEVIATVMALTVGAMSLIRYYSHTENKYLLVGLGFIGTALLDSFHASVTSIWFHEFFPSQLERLLPWSWIASRLFLAIMLTLSVAPWLGRNPPVIKNPSNEPRIYFLAASAILGCFAFIAFVSLPPGYFAHMAVSRPEEWLPALFFALALVGYLRQGAWRTVDIDHWMVLALITSLIGQIGFMAFSTHLFDARFDIAHALKQISYLFVLIGLLITTYKSFKQLEREILEHRQADIKNRMLVTAIEKNPVAVMVTNAQAQIDYCNSKALQMLGYKSEEVIGQNPKMFASGKTPIHTYNSMWETLSKGEDWKGIFFNKKRNGEELIEESHISPIMDENQNITHFVAIKLDATERTLKEQDTWYKANYDWLTTLPNRGLFLDRAHNALKNAKRANAGIAILFIDLDGFKAVNDTYGHQAGDKLLQWVASQISRAIRDSDTVSRFGGDEFGLLLSNFSEQEEVRLVAEKVLSAINQPCSIGDVEVVISASIGIALYPEHGDDISMLITRADSAMYQIKKHTGSGGIAFYTHLA